MLWPYLITPWHIRQAWPNFSFELFLFSFFFSFSFPVSAARGFLKPKPPVEFPMERALWLPLQRGTTLPKSQYKLLLVSTKMHGSTTHERNIDFRKKKIPRWKEFVEAVDYLFSGICARVYCLSCMSLICSALLRVWSLLVSTRFERAGR